MNFRWSTSFGPSVSVSAIGASWTFRFALTALSTSSTWARRSPTHCYPWTFVGGFTVLNALASSDVFTAGASFSGIADLADWRETSHKFESHCDGILLVKRRFEKRTKTRC